MFRPVQNFSERDDVTSVGVIESLIASPPIKRPGQDFVPDYQANQCMISSSASMERAVDGFQMIGREEGHTDSFILAQSMRHPSSENDKGFGFDN